MKINIKYGDGKKIIFEGNGFEGLKKVDDLLK